MRITTWCAALAAALWLGACRGKGGGESEDTYRTEGEISLPDSGIQLDQGGGDEKVPFPVQCTQDSDCDGPEEVCNCFGMCVMKGTVKCQEDKNCGSSAYCDPCSGWCYPQRKLCEPCTSEHLCNPITGECMPVGNQCEIEGSHCLDYVAGGSFCGRACLSDAGCPSGYVCQDLSDFGLEYSQCVPIGGDCTKVGECESDLDCAYGFICNSNKLCAKGCENDASCPNGMVCSAFRCVPACDPVTNPCPEGQVCEEGRCRIPGGCVDAFDCPEPETHCDMDSHTCQPGCEHDLDCKSAAKVCKQNKCVAKGCTANYWCNHGEVCNLETGECVVPPEPFCKPGCVEDAECGPEPSKCLELQDEQGNSQGKYCFPKCYDDPENRCPQGYQCINLQDENGNPLGEVCARQCNKEPVGL